MNLTFVLRECHIGKQLSLQELTQLIRIKLLIFTYYRNFCFLVPISRGGQMPVLPPPADAHAGHPCYRGSGACIPRALIFETHWKTDWGDSLIHLKEGQTEKYIWKTKGKWFYTKLLDKYSMKLQNPKMLLRIKYPAKLTENKGKTAI